MAKIGFGAHVFSGNPLRAVTKRGHISYQQRSRDISCGLAHLGIDDDVRPTEHDQSPFRVPGFRDLFWEQRVGRPVKVLRGRTSERARRRSLGDVEEPLTRWIAFAIPSSVAMRYFNRHSRPYTMMPIKSVEVGHPSVPRIRLHLWLGGSKSCNRGLLMARTSSQPSRNAPEPDDSPPSQEQNTTGSTNAFRLVNPGTSFKIHVCATLPFE